MSSGPNEHELPLRASAALARPGSVTIKDVARAAGVGTMTVSRVVTNRGYVAAPTRQRVLDAMSELGYVPNDVARGLRSKTTGTLALVVTDIANPFFTTVARGAEDAASGAGQLVLFCNTDESEEEELRYLTLLAQKRVDGVLLVPARDGSASIEFLKRRHMPVVVLDRSIASPSVDVVRCDSWDGAFQLGKMMAGFGHRVFALLTGPAGISTSDLRVDGFLEGTRSVAEGVQCDVIYGRFRRDDGMRMARQAMGASLRPTAIFAANNFISIGALQALLEQGFRVPEDVAIVGFDDLPEGMVTFPFLTVASQPAYEMGKVAVQVLLDRLSAKQTGEPRETVLPTSIVIRKSSGGTLH